ncbi:MAG: UDP-N-acetylmuramate dehydrogenase [Candidatus Liptonbacteria bacterium]|nr:UDP-N-acetylmuramate dehydrogenase [Candidatus Liptonbacteria bacterium]
MRFDKNISLARRVAFKIGGRARYFFEAKNVAELKAAIDKAGEEKLPVLVIGEGTNMLMGDKGFNGLVLKPNLTGLKADGEQIYAEAGVSMRELVAFAAKHSLSGLEWAGGLPGTVGGAIRGNAGAFGGEIKDSVVRVVSLNIRTTRTLERFNRACRFKYRSSIFKEKQGEEIVIAAVFDLKKANQQRIRAATEERIIYRKERHPLEYPNVGSIFQNVDVKKVPVKILKLVAHVIKQDPFPVVPAAYLISEAGLKGVRVGDAQVSLKHPNFIVNVGKAKAEDVKKLISRVKQVVKKKFGITLEPEVQIF